MNIAIVVTTHNYYKYTAICLKSLYKTIGYDYPVIIIDDASTDETLSQILIDFPSIILKTEPMLCLAQSWNKGIRLGFKMGADYVCVLNNDMEFKDPLWLNELIKAFDNDDTHPVGVTCSRSYTSKGLKEQLGIPGFGWQHFCSPMSLLDHNNPISLIQFRKETRQGRRWRSLDYSGILPIYDMYGGSFVVSKDTIKNVGYFDEEFIFGCEEYDYSWRCWKADMKVVMNTESKVIHHGGTARKDIGWYNLILSKSKQFDRSFAHPKWLLCHKHPEKERKLIWNTKINPLLRKQGIHLK